MDNLYGYSLFTRDDLPRAYNYITHNNESENIRKEDHLRYRLVSSEYYRISAVIIMANIKKVNHICNEYILPNLSLYLSSKGEKFGYITIDLDNVINTINQFLYPSEILATKVMPYVVSENFSSIDSWIYFDGFVNKALEQIIKLKYSDRITYDRDRLYLKLQSEETFSFIYDLMDDIYSTC